MSKEKNVVDIMSAIQIKKDTPIYEWDGDPENVLSDRPPAPPYQFGLLPAPYERMMQAKMDYWGTCPEIYAGPFINSVAMNLNTDVQVEVQPGSGRTNAVNIIEYGCTCAPPGDSKSAAMKDVLGTDQGPAREWDIEAMGRALSIRDSKATKEEKKEVPIPVSIHNSFTVEALKDHMAANLSYKLPTSIVSEEMHDALSGGGRASQNGYSAFMDFWKTAFDNSPHRSSTKGGGVVNLPKTVLNTYFCTTPDALGRWPDFDRAIGDGSLARNTFYTSTKRHEKSSDVLDPNGFLTKWWTIQYRCQRLDKVLLLLPHDPELAEKVAEARDMGNQMAEASIPAGYWLKKIEPHLARVAAVFHIVEHLESYRDDFCKPSEERPIKIPEQISSDTMWRAWRYVMEFMFPQQLYFYDTLLSVGEVGQAMKQTVMKIVDRGLTEVKKEDLVGSHAISGVRTWKDYMKDKLLDALFSRNIILPMPPGRNQPQHTPGRELYMAGRFAIHPKLGEVYAKDLGRIRKLRAWQRGEMKENFTKRSKEL